MQKDVVTTLLYSTGSAASSGSTIGTAVNINASANYADIGVKPFKVAAVIVSSSGSPAGSIQLTESSGSSGTFTSVLTDDATPGTVTFNLTSGPNQTQIVESNAYITKPWVKVTLPTFSTGGSIIGEVLIQGQTRSA
jgi:hypothetical protein